TNNIAKGFATTFIPSFRILLINLQRLVGKDVIIKFMNDIGFVENILLRQARSKMKEGIKMFIQLSNPLGWAYTLINLIKSGVDLTQFVNKGGLIGKLELVKNTGLGRFGAYDETLGYFLDGTLRKTFSSIITDLSTNLFDSNIGQISAYSLKLLVLGNEVTTISPYKVKDQNKSPIKSIMAPLNKQVAIVASSAAEGVIDQFLSYMNEDLFDEASLHIDDEEEKDYRDVLQSLGEVAGDQIAFILAAYATTLLPVTKTVSELLTDKEPVSRLQQAVSNGAALVALATAQSGAFLYNKLT
ncbi:MAG: hypothetical protein H7263_16545, partial [Candidatus Sericytochromatia bacterium]|nr:hypothetical protein [Candidatus Sericytochromatia bacterium]